MATRRSNPTWTDEEYERRHGTERINLRLPSRTLAVLAALADARGISRADFVAQLINDAAAADEARRAQDRADRDRREERRRERQRRAGQGSRHLEDVIAAYQTLELEVPSDPFTPNMDLVRTTYRALAHRYHPDRHPGDQEIAARAARINAAYHVLLALDA